MSAASSQLTAAGSATDADSRAAARGCIELAALTTIKANDPYNTYLRMVLSRLSLRYSAQTAAKTAQRADGTVPAAVDRI
jgi:hypothetical protein